MIYLQRGCVMRSKRAPLKTLARGLEALEYLARHPEGCRNAEVARYLNVDHSSSVRILQTLRYTGFAYREDGKYHISYRLFGLLREFQQWLGGFIHPIIKQIAKETGFTATFAVWEGLHAIPVLLEQGQAPLVVNSNLGSAVPPHASAMGKVLLAFKENEELNELLSTITLSPLTPNTITNLQKLRIELENVRKNGYAVDREEYRPGVRCVAFPVFNREDKSLAAISVSYPVTYETAIPTFEESIRKKVQAAVDRLNERLGQKRR